jgi:mannose-6-phosphate isomerase-like protein (cupin superfamily)
VSTRPSPTVVVAPRDVVDQLPWQPLPGCQGVSTKVVTDVDGDVAGLLRLRPGAREVAHVHGHGSHHLWVLSGGVVVEDTPLPAGSYLHVPSGLVHDLRDTGSGSTLFYVFSRDR